MANFLCTVYKGDVWDIFIIFTDSFVFPFTNTHSIPTSTLIKHINKQIVSSFILNWPYILGFAFVIYIKILPLFYIQMRSGKKKGPPTPCTILFTTHWLRRRQIIVTLTQLTHRTKLKNAKLPTTTFNNILTGVKAIIVSRRIEYTNTMSH